MLFTICAHFIAVALGHMTVVQYFMSWDKYGKDYSSPACNQTSWIDSQHVTPTYKNCSGLAYI